jgi:hypothetical protein
VGILIYLRDSAKVEPSSVTVQINGYGNPLILRAKSAHQIDDKADHQNQANSAASDHGTAKVKPAAAKQQEQDNQN